jgi:hypothetical protein
MIEAKEQSPPTGRLPVVNEEPNGKTRLAAEDRAGSRNPVHASHWIVVGIFALVLAASATTSAQAGVAAVTAAGDRTATHKLLKADYELVKANLARDGAAEAAVDQAAKALGHECKGALRGVPDGSMIEEEDGPSESPPRLSGRTQGEHARSELEKQTIDLEIDETILAAGDRVLRGPDDAYIATADRLTWSDPTITALIHQKVTRLRKDLLGPPVAACAEMRAWAASGFHRLPPGSRRQEEAEQAQSKQVVEGNLEMLLRPYEGLAEQAILRRTRALEEKLSEKERADEVESGAVYHMDLALGEKVSHAAKQQFAPVIAEGRTHAGTTFVIRANVGKSLEGSCRREVQVEVSERHGESGVGVCLGERAHPQPSSSCSGPVETIQFATPSDVRRVRVRLSDGQTVTVSVVQIPAKDRGPAGVFIDAFRGYKPYPVSAQELSSDGSVLRTLHLTGVRCRKESASEAPGSPQDVNLATVMAPSGEPLYIEGFLHSFRGRTSFFLAPSRGVHNSEASEEHGKQKQFQWDFSTECAPHPYSLLYGILLPPGASVLARTPAGLTPLTKVELAAPVHAEGPLFYGIYTSPPTEIVVERSEGTVLYTENLAHKAAEETEFCEGYAEP